MGSRREHQSIGIGRPEQVAFLEQLLEKRADVMITDASEALYQQKLKPGLCAVNPTQYLQYGEKAYLLPRDDRAHELFGFRLHSFGRAAAIRAASSAGVVWIGRAAPITPPPAGARRGRAARLCHRASAFTRPPAGERGRARDCHCPIQPSLDRSSSKYV